METTKTTNILIQLQHLIDLIYKHNIMDLPIVVSTSTWEDNQLDITVDRNKLTAEQAFNFKKAFGPFEKQLADLGSRKDAVHILEFDDGTRLNARLERLYTCSTLSPEQVTGLSEDERKKVWEQAEAGIITFQQCTIQEGPK